MVPVQVFWKAPRIDGAIPDDGNRVESTVYSPVDILVFELFSLLLSFNYFLYVFYFFLAILALLNDITEYFREF